MARRTKEYFKGMLYLPHWLRDFHDQKRFFKTMVSATYENALKHLKEEPDSIWKQVVEKFDKISWVDKHCFVIDELLPYLSRCGYTLQKSRTHKGDLDIFAEMDKYDKKQLEDFAQYLKKEAERNKEEEKALKDHITPKPYFCDNSTGNHCMGRFKWNRNMCACCLFNTTKQFEDHFIPFEGEDDE